MAKAYRVFDEGYEYKFETLDDPNPLGWAIGKQSEGCQVEEGNLVWINDVCSWTWDKKIVSQPIRKHTNITEEIFNQVWDRKGTTQMKIADELGLSQRTVSSILCLVGVKYKKFMRRRNG